VSTT
jgi:hypothetical protein